MRTTLLLGVLLSGLAAALAAPGAVEPRAGGATNKTVLFVYGDATNAAAFADLLKAAGLTCRTLPQTEIPDQAHAVERPPDLPAADLVVFLACCRGGWSAGQAWYAGLLEGLGTARVLACGNSGAALLQTRHLLIGHPNGWHGLDAPKVVLFPRDVVANAEGEILRRPHDLLGAARDDMAVEIHAGTNALEHVGIYDNGRFPEGTVGLGREPADRHHWIICRQGNYALWGADSRYEALTEDGRALFANLCWYLAHLPPQELAWPQKEFLKPGVHEAVLRGGARHQYFLALQKPGPLRLGLEWKGTNVMMFMPHDPLVKRGDGRSPLAHRQASV